MKSTLTPSVMITIASMAAALASWPPAQAGTPACVAPDGPPPAIAQAAPAAPTPDSAAPEARLQAMQARMLQLRDTVDPRTWVPLMEAQMTDMEAMLKTMKEMCPMMSDAGGASQPRADAPAAAGR